METREAAAATFMLRLSLRRLQPACNSSLIPVINFFGDSVPKTPATFFNKKVAKKRDL
jgi:hypothetical protein